jgi:hypothetical protein
LNLVAFFRIDVVVGIIVDAAAIGLETTIRGKWPTRDSIPGTTIQLDNMPLLIRCDDDRVCL